MVSKSSKAQRLSSTDFAYQSIQGLILSGKYKPGQRLIYANLEKILGISKTPIISALSLLESRGFVSYIKNRGYFVTDMDLNRLSQQMGPQATGEVSADPMDATATDDLFAPTSMNAVIYGKIKELIRTLKVAPGQKLVYSDLEKKFGVSKTPIINALSKLESEGYVYIKKNVGCYVKEVHPDEINEVMEARTCLEVSNIDFIMQHVTAEDIAQLETLQEAYCAHKTDIFDRLKLIANANFHICLAQMGRNRFMVRYIQSIYEWLELRVRLDVLPPERIIQSEKEHAEMIAALHRRDAEKLKSLLRKHLKATAPFHLEGRFVKP
ncbi:hypothetical protein JCM12296A_34950 [Desulfosarcina cetonica]|uniref:GntR family transcriptional regulator n=1 Tax=Desulfosarcina cetonica TaxID=90730 RepID=UPI00155DA1D7|nr:GntR family transcriptional regulator [Desulfosarcina cetonica]